MKNALLLTLVLFWMQIHAQESLCDYTYTTGSQAEFEVAAPTTGNGLPEMVPLFMTTSADDIMLGQDSCFGMPCTHTVFNSILADTVTTCIDYALSDAASGVVDTLTCCFDQEWDASSQFWVRVEAPSNIQELVGMPTRDDRIFDLFGRELPEAPFGQVYIQNRKLHFRSNE